MKAYHNTAVLKFDDETTGNAASGASVTVRINSSQALASIFDLDDLSIANPLMADSNGNYAFKAADDIYDIIVSEGTANEVRLEKVEIAEIPTAPILINDISQTYDFNTAQLAADSAIIFPLNKFLKTKGRYAVDDNLGCSYMVKSVSETSFDILLTDGKYAVFKGYTGLSVHQSLPPSLCRSCQ
jgi:hypothetical protein